MKVLITAPSLDEARNVSGISTLVRNIIRRGRSKFVHFEAGRKDGEAADAGWLLRQAALPVRFFQRLMTEKPDVVHLNTAFIPLAIWRDAALAGAARLAGKPVLLHIHGGPFVTEDIRDTALRTVAERFVGMARSVIVFSEAERKSLLRRYPGADIHILPNAVPLDELPAEQRQPGEKTLIFFGRLNESKGLGHITDACRVLVEQGFTFRYVCYGAGPELERFVTEMSRLLGDRFSYRGIARGAEKWKALGGADIFFLPSRDEGMPIALLEAMAAGCVPVVSVSGGVADVIEDGHNGFLIEAGNTQQTVGRLKMLLSESTKGWNELRENARNTVRERYAFESFVDRLEKLYARTAADK